MDDIVIVDYKPAWPARFAEEAALIKTALGDSAAVIEHFGSTAVSGLPPNGPRTHPVHVVEAGGMSFADRLLFRDCLRADPEEARRYAELKRELAVAFPGDREAYTDGKSDYIYGVMQKAR